ncbi:dienelactone hydrolase family protein [Paenibacillus sp. FSL K6-3182]|uniref:dienelactone hydrolase family protein n=1 Tax=unclassified Paenibacillus TaxID=185978 RepID=UPI0030D535D7
MISIINGSETLIIVIHEIYGINRHMQHICQSLADHDFDVICPNLLVQEVPFDYANEETAYRHFMENVGFIKASNQIKQLVFDKRANYKKVFLAGFSVGATAAWLCSEEPEVDGIAAYYGSRIRNYTELLPKCPTILFFPQEELSFHVDDLISILSKNDANEIHKFSGQHGFSDPYSHKYNEQSAQKAFSEMVGFFHNIERF